MDEQMNGRMIELMNEWMGGCTSGRMGGWAILRLPQNPNPTKKLDLTKQAPPAIDRLGSDGESRRRKEGAKKKKVSCWLAHGAQTPCGALLTLRQTPGVELCRQSRGRSARRVTCGAGPKRTEVIGPLRDAATNSDSARQRVGEEQSYILRVVHSPTGVAH